MSLANAWDTWEAARSRVITFDIHYSLIKITIFFIIHAPLVLKKNRDCQWTAYSNMKALGFWDCIRVATVGNFKLKCFLNACRLYCFVCVPWRRPLRDLFKCRMRFYRAMFISLAEHFNPDPVWIGLPKPKSNGGIQFRIKLTSCRAETKKVLVLTRGYIHCPRCLYANCHPCVTGSSI